MFSTGVRGVWLRDGNLKEVSSNATPEFRFGAFYICVDFNLRNQKAKRGM